MNLRTFVMSVMFMFGTAGHMPSAIAALITYYYAGNFVQGGGTAPSSLLGTGFTGTLNYDTAASVQSSTANTITYAPGSASLSVQTILGGGQTQAGAGAFKSTWDSGTATSLNGFFSPADEFAIGGTSSYDAALSMFTVMNIQLVDGTGAPADDPFGAPLSAPPTVLSLSEMDAAEFHMAGTGVQDGVFQTLAFLAGSLTCLSSDRDGCQPVSNVPEPQSYALMLAGLGLVGWVARRRKLAQHPNGN